MNALDGSFTEPLPGGVGLRLVVTVLLMPCPALL